MASWNPQTQSGGAEQTLELNGTTLSLVPNGGSVVIPTGYISSLASVVFVSSLIAKNDIYLPSSNAPLITLAANGTVAANLFSGPFANITSGNFNGLSVVSTGIFIGSISTLTSQSAAIKTLTNQSATISNVLNVGQLQLSNAGSASVFSQTNNQINLDANLYMYSPFTLTTSNGTIDSLNTTTTFAQQLTVQNLASTSVIVLNGNVLSNTTSNLTYNGSNITTGQQGDASQWAQYPATGYVNVGGQGLGGVNGLEVDSGNINFLIDSRGSGANFTIGTSFNANPFYSQPNFNAYCENVNISAGAQVAPYYFSGNKINLDAYAGASPIPYLNDNDSAINITAHGNLSVKIPGIGPAIPSAGKGAVNITAYNAYLNGVPDPTEIGVINLNGGQVNVGNNNFLPWGSTEFVNLQALAIQIVSGSILVPDVFPSLHVRAGGGMMLDTDLTNTTSNTDSIIYVKQINAQKNILDDPFGEYLTLDGKSGGLSLNNFKVAYGQGAGADLNNIATMTGAYPVLVSSMINNVLNYSAYTYNLLQNEINAIVSGGGSNLSNITTWYLWPAQSTLTVNQNIVANKSMFSISTVNGLTLTTFAGALAPITASQLVLPGYNSLGFTDAFNFALLSGGAAPIRVSSVVLNTQGTDYLLQTSNASLYFNGQQVATTNNISTITSYSNLNLQTINATAPSSLTVYGPLIAPSSIYTNSVVIGSNGNFASFSSDINGSLYLGATRGSTIGMPISAVYDTGFNRFQLQLSNVSTINGVQYIPGGGGTSSLVLWSQFPVVNGGAVGFGSQPGRFTASNNFSFSNYSGTYLPVLAGSFNVSVYGGTGGSLGLLSNSLAILNPAGNATGLCVSSLSMNGSIVSVSSSALYVGGNNVVAGWASYPTNSTVSVVGTNPSNKTYFFIGSNGDIFSVYGSAAGTVIASSNLTLAANLTTPYGLTSLGTIITPNASVSSITFQNSNTLSTSNSALMFNGVVINTSTTIQSWATYPASVQPQSAFGFNSYSATSGNYTSFAGGNSVGRFSIYNDSTGATNISTIALSLTNNVAVAGSLTAASLTTGLVSAVSTATSTLMLNDTGLTASAGTLFVNTVPLLPMYPELQLGNNNSFSYVSANGLYPITGLTTVLPTFNYGIFTCYLTIPNTCYLGGTNYMKIGLGPAGQSANNQQQMVNVPLPASGNNSAFRCSFMVDFTAYLGSYWSVRMIASVADTFGFSNVKIKPLPN